ncbi:MAG: hypothetical protein ISS76_15525 [Phycisphaerae bacterium]|nr:hypothetical protein [Phycisphaerae bacterium]
MCVIAPTHDRFTSLIRTLTKCAKQDVICPKPFNRIGIGLIITYGKAVLVFGDDIESPSWNKVRKRLPQLQPHWVKVSHHGASSGNPRGLWKWFRRKDGATDKLHALVSADGRRKPLPRVVTEIRDCARLHTTYTVKEKGRRRTSPPPRSWPSVHEFPSDSWLSGLYPGGCVCAFRVYPNGDVFRDNCECKSTG